MRRLHVTHLLTDFMDESLDWQPTERVKAHLAFCNACRQGLHDLKRGIALLRATPGAVPSSDLERRIVDWMSVERSRPAEDRRRTPSWILRLAENKRAAVLAIALLTGMLVVRAMIHRNVTTRRPRPAAAAPQPPRPVDPKKTETKAAVKSSVVKPSAIAIAAAKAAEAKARADVMPAPLEGSQSGITDEMTQTVTSEMAWRELWLRHNAKVERVPKLPDVDFSKNQVIAIFAGQKPTGGYRVQVLSVTETPWNGAPARLVKYRVQTPPKNAITTQVITNPFLFRVVPRFSGATFFEKNP